MKKIMSFVLDVMTLTELVALGMAAIAFSTVSLHRISLGENAVTYLCWFVLMSFALVLDAIAIRQVWNGVTGKIDEFDEDVTEEENEA